MATSIGGVSIDRFNGVLPEEIYQRDLADRIDYDLDIIFVNFCPSLYSVYVEQHFSGPGNHFYHCMHDSGLSDRLLKSSEDKLLLDTKMGLVNMLQKATQKTYQDLSFSEIKKAQENLSERINEYQPKIVAFNGKLIYEIFTGKSVNRDFNFGKQPMRFDNDNESSFVYVLPSSEARCPSYRLIPKHTDKVPFYKGLKKFRDYLNGSLNYALDDKEITFPEFKIALEYNPDSDSENVDSTDLNTSLYEDKDSKLNGSISGTPRKTGTPQVKRFHRLNNLPYSEIPANMLESLQLLRRQKKDIIIPTSAKCYQNISMKKSTGLVSEPEMVNKLAVTPVKIYDQGSNGAPSVTSGSGLDETTNDSDSLSNTSIIGYKIEQNDQPIKPENCEEIINQAKIQLNQEKSNAKAPTPTTILNSPNISKPLKQLQPKPAVLNIPSNANNTIKKILSAPINLNNVNQGISLRNITAQTVNFYLPQNGKNQQKPIVNHYGQPTKLNGPTQTFKIVNINQNQTASNTTVGNNVSFKAQILNESPNQVKRKDQNTIIMLNGNKTNKNVKIVPKNKDIAPSVNKLPVTNTKIAITTTNNSENQSKAISNNHVVIENKIIEETIEVNENIPKYLQPDENLEYIPYELVIQDNNYRFGEYYTFDEKNVMQKYTDDENKKNLNRVIHLNYGNEQSELSLFLPAKRYFSDLKEADQTILNSSEAKRVCRVDILKI